MAGNFVLAGTALFLLVIGAFAILRSVNRFLIVLLSISFFLFSASAAIAGLNAIATGIAPWPRGRYDLVDATLQQAPAAYWLSTTFLWALAAGCGAMGLYLLSISLRRRRHGP